MRHDGESETNVIELRLRDVDQLFDALDPAPFHEKELNSNAEEYLVESAKELLSGVPREIVLYVDRPKYVDGDIAIGSAIRDHFARRSTQLQRAMRRLLRRGFVSLLIGLSFLTAMFALAQALGAWVGDHAVARVLHEGLMIIGWVAMWKPLEILLYDWWPILAERRLFDRLSRVPVRIVDDKQA